MKDFLKSIGILFFVLFSLNCGGSSKSEDPAAPIVTTGSLLIHNLASQSINEVYMSPVSEELWGTNKINSVILTQASREIENITPGNYDAKGKIIGTLSDYYAYLFNFGIIKGESTDLYPQDSDFSGSLKLLNQSTLNIVELYVSPASSSTWGPNVIGSSVIAPNIFYHMYGLIADDYDVAVVLDNGGVAYAQIIINSLELYELYYNESDIINGKILSEIEYSENDEGYVKDEKIFEYKKHLDGEGKTK